MKLFWRPQTRASRVEWVLAELGEQYERVLAPEGGTPARLRLHPLGRVPVLEDDAGVLRLESVALCTWLADRRPERGLIPRAGTPERATHDQWLMLVVTEVEPLLDLICLHSEELPP
ncbi:MAG: glutathione S-transferase family protein, partial [Myxococcaceae bacterium]